MFLFFLFFLEIETKETKDKGKYFKTLQDLITLNGSHFMGAISCFYFPFILKDRDKRDKDKNARERRGLNSICLFCLLFIKKDSTNAGGNHRPAFSRFYFSFYF